MKLNRIIEEYLNNNCWMCLCKWISFTFFFFFIFTAEHKHQRSFVYCKQQNWNSGEEIEWLKITELNIFLSFFASFSKFDTDPFFILLLLSFGSSADVKFLSFHCKISENSLPNQNHNWKETVYSMALIISIILVCELWIVGWLIGRSSHRLDKNSVSLQWILCFGVN